MERLKSSLRKFYSRYGDLIKQYEVSLSQMLMTFCDLTIYNDNPLLIRLCTELDLLPNFEWFPTGGAYSSGYLVPSLWDLHMFYLLRPILFRTCRYLTGLCSSNIPRYIVLSRFCFFTIPTFTDELMFFTPAISSTISRAAPSNVHFRPGVMFLPIAPRCLKQCGHL